MLDHRFGIRKHILMRLKYVSGHFKRASNIIYIKIINIFTSIQFKNEIENTFPRSSFRSAIFLNRDYFKKNKSISEYNPVDNL